MEKSIETAVSSLHVQSKCAQIAFFGGSFTAIERGYMIMLLETAYSYVKRGLFEGIRISTRPDAIDGEILDILERYKVTSIELGAQSMDEEVLSKNLRGHSAKDVENASKLIKQRGFSLGLQMMTGLYADTDEKVIKTAESIIALQPETVRIYPTILMPGTYLEYLYKKGDYAPQTLESAVNLCCVLLEMFEKAKIKVIRMGLHDTENIKEEMIAGPYHPAFRELCESLMLRRKMERLTLPDKSAYVFEVNPKDISKAIGQKKSNIRYFEEKGIKISFIQNEEIKPLECKLYRTVKV